MRPAWMLLTGALGVTACTPDPDSGTDSNADTDTDTNTDTAANVFDVDFTGTGYGVDANKPVHYALVHLTERTVIAIVDGTVPTDGALAASFPQSITTTDVGLAVVWYIDVNDVAGCQDPGDLIWGDDQWTVAVPDHATTDQAVSFAYTSEFTPVCWAFNQM